MRIVYTYVYRVSMGMGEHISDTHSFPHWPAMHEKLAKRRLMASTQGVQPGLLLVPYLVLCHNLMLSNLQASARPSAVRSNMSQVYSLGVTCCF
jgi:hypothetical protein